MPKGRAAPPPPPPEPERVTIINLKGTEEERDFLRSAVRRTGVPAATIARRGMAMWLRANAKMEPPATWTGEE